MSTRRSVERFWSDHVADLTPYVPGEQPAETHLIKLNTNESPYGPSPRALAAMRECVDDTLRLYPDPESLHLRCVLAQGWRLTPEQVFVGNGSDEVLAHVFYSFFLRGGRPVLMPDISYNFYQSWCRLYRVPHQLVPLTDDFRINVQDYLAQAKQMGEAAGQAPAAVIFANPNAPTGIALGLDDIRQLARGLPETLIVVDEAYVGFGVESAAALLGQFENLLITHTFSKSYGLAGLRTGYILAHPDLIAALARTKNSFNAYPLDSLAQAGAAAAFEDRQYFEQTCQTIMHARDRLRTDLQALGFDVLPSQTNFLFARHPAHSGTALAQGLRQQKILVRRFNQPRIADFLRITVGTPQQCERLVEVLRGLVRG